MVLLGSQSSLPTTLRCNALAVLCSTNSSLSIYVFPEPHNSIAFIAEFHEFLIDCSTVVLCQAQPWHLRTG